MLAVVLCTLSANSGLSPPAPVRRGLYRLHFSSNFCNILVAHRCTHKIFAHSHTDDGINWVQQRNGNYPPPKLTGLTFSNRMELMLFVYLLCRQILIRQKQRGKHNSTNIISLERIVAIFVYLCFSESPKAWSCDEFWWRWCVGTGGELSWLATVLQGL